MFNTSATLFRLALNGKSISRSLRTTTIVESETKTPVQKIGWEYLLKQRAKNRPISPHLSVYTPPLTMILSGFHRISGCVMAGTLLFGGIGFAVLPLDFTAFVEFIRSWNLPDPIVAAFKFIIAFPIIFHTLNGVRFIAFDLAKGVDNIGQVYTSGRLVLVASAVIAPCCRFQLISQENVKVISYLNSHEV